MADTTLVYVTNFAREMQPTLERALENAGGEIGADVDATGTYHVFSTPVAGPSLLVRLPTERLARLVDALRPIQVVTEAGIL